MQNKIQSKKTLRKISFDKTQEKPKYQINVRSIVNSNSKGMFKNVHQIHQSASKQLRPIQTAQEKQRMLAIKQSFDSTVSVIQQKLTKIQVDQLSTIKAVENIKIETMNFSKKRNQEIKFSLQSDQNWKIWVGKVFIQVCDRAFQLFLNNDLTYQQMKAFCSQKILLHLTQLSMHPKFKGSDEFQQQLYQQLKKIVDYLCSKYPQTEKSQINKRLKEITEKNIINNSQNDDYDLIDQSGIQLNFNEDGDYSKQIMKFMNYLITLTSVPTQNGKNLYYNFQTFMQNIFTIVEINDKKNDLGLLADQIIKDNEKYVLKFSKEEEIQYQQKVKQYTHYAIGSKIPPNTPLYTEEEMISGHVDIKNKTVARTLDKWTEELYDKMEKAQKQILERTYRFKGIIPGTRLKPNPQMKELLYKSIKKQAQKNNQFKNQLCNNVLYISKGVIRDLPGLKNLSFIPQNQRSMAELACKVQQASVQYSIQYINKLIHGLLRGVQNFKKQWSQITKFPQQNLLNQNANVNLVTCKIGDLLRCKFASKEEEVVRIFQFLLAMSQMNYLGIFKIIRIKNRLNQGTRDILINAYFKNKVVCQIQLAVNQSSHQKQSYMDKFNHFLYELKRAQQGVLMQLCGVWVNYDPKSKIFIKAIEQENKAKMKIRNSLCPITFMMDTDYETITFPFICKICKIFQTGQKTIFENVKFSTHQQPICGECLSSRMQIQQRKIIIFRYHLKKNVRHKKLLDKLQQIFTHQQIDKNDIFFMIPKNARKINKYYVRKVETGNRIFFVQNAFVNGKLEIQTKFSVSKQELKTYQKKIFQKYCIFIFKVPYQMKSIDFSKKIFFQLVKKDVQYLKDPNPKDKISCLQLQCDNRVILFPFYKNENCQITYLKKSQNKKFIIKKVQESKQVLQVSKRKITSQLTQLPRGILLKMNLFIKQLYLDENRIQEVNFIQHMQILQVLTARNMIKYLGDNRLKQIPPIPTCLLTLDLTHNEIQKINKLKHAENFNLKILILCSNQIQKIQNLENLKMINYLVLSFNIISKIQNIEELNKVQRLILFQNPIRKIENIQNLKKLGYLVLGNSLVQNIENLQKCQNLTFLHINNAKLKKIQKINHLTKLTKIMLQNNEIQQIQNLDNFSDLIELNLNKNKIQSMKNLDNILNIKKLNLSNNFIQSIEFLDNLFELRELYLANNRISKLEGLQENFMLEKIDLSGNLIQAILNIGHLGFLKQLQLSRNNIKVIQNIQDLSSLEQLTIQKNEVTQIVSLPSFIKWINLRIKIFIQNKIKYRVLIGYKTYRTRNRYNKQNQEVIFYKKNRFQ